MIKYCILGTDERNNNLKRLYKEEGKKLVDIENSKVIITATPFTKDGVNLTGEEIKCDELISIMDNTDKVLISGAIPKEIKEKLEAKNIKFFDIMQNDELAIYNAIPTAEGAISIAIENTDFTIHNSNCLVLGFGRVGKILANTLRGLGTNVYVEARKEKDIAQIDALNYNSIKLVDLEDNLSNMDIIFNTVPYMMLDENRLKLVNDKSLIIDLASRPGGVDFEVAKKLNKKVIWALAIPSKVAPYTSAVYMKKVIDNIIDKEINV